MEKAPAILDPAIQILDSLEFCRKEDVEESRKERLAKNYVLDRVAEKLAAGGHGRLFARRMATTILNDKAKLAGDTEAIRPLESGAFYKGPNDEFDPGCVCYITESDTDAPKKSNHKSFIDGVATSIAENVAKKKQDISRTLNKKGWPSGMTKLDINITSVPDHLGMIGAASYASDLGASPWIVGYRPNSWRYGPAEHPLPGLAQYITARDASLVVHAFQVSALVAEGLSVSDIHQFLETASGTEWVKENSVSVVLREGHTLYVPYGVVAAVAHYYDAKPKDPCPMSHIHIHTPYLAL